MRLQERLKDPRLQEEIRRILSKISAYEGTEMISSPIPILVYSTSGKFSYISAFFFPTSKSDVPSHLGEDSPSYISPFFFLFRPTALGGRCPLPGASRWESKISPSVSQGGQRVREGCGRGKSTGTIGTAWENLEVVSSHSNGWCTLTLSLHAYFICSDFVVNGQAT